MVRFVVVVVAGVLLVPVASGAGGGQGRLVVKDRHVDNGSFFIEGAFQYLVVKRRGEVVFRKRYPFGAAKLNRAFAGGRYRLVSYTRSCAASCPPEDPPRCTEDSCPTYGALDPPSDRCHADFRLRPAARVAFALRTAAGERCRLKRVD